MNPRDVFETWAPSGGVWSPWVKPVLFAHMADRAEGLEKAKTAEVHPEPPPAPARTLAEGTAIVVDLPGVESIAAGLDLVRLGFRPVPLFNGCPAPTFLGRPYDEVVPTGGLIAALVNGANTLATAPLPPGAPRLSCSTPIGSKARDGASARCSTTAGSYSRPTSPRPACWRTGASGMSSLCTAAGSITTWSRCSGAGNGTGSR